MQFRFRRALCLLLMLFLILSAVPGAPGLPAALAEDTADVAVQSAPLERSAATRDGMVRVRLLSIGSNPASLTVTAVGAMAVSGGQTMALSGGEQVSISHSSATGEIRLTRGGETVSMGREMALRRRQTDGGFRIAQARRPQNVYPGDLHLVSKLESGTYRLYVVANVYIESYLYGVVPYEMGSSSALEALKAQAICARTYAYGHMLRAGYPRYGAHVDDSTSYQVYNNITEADSATTAVKETYGQMILTDEGTVANTYYYSTSCGVGTTANVWKTAEAEALDYLKSSRLNPESLMQTDGGVIAADSNEVNRDAGPEDLREEEAFRDFITETHAEDYEAQEGWYRWTYTVKEIDVDRIVETLKKRYEANGKLILTLKDDDYVSQNIKAFSKVNDISVVKRGPGGVADEMVIVTDKGTFKVISEYNIRAVLCDGVTKVVRQDGSEVAMPNLLPSAFFVIEPSHDKKNVVGYNIIGGGFGHGVGMSQNGAKNMALQGLGAEQILNFFYEGCEICSGQ